MKVLSTILAVYMMTVFLMPCTDIFEKETFHNHSYAEELVHQDNYGHSEAIDMCSPFCLCNCCGAVSGFYWNTVSFSEMRMIELSKPNSQYISQFTPRYFGEIWQPPKVSA